MSTRRKTLEQVLQEATDQWGDRWDYSKVEYKNGSTPITIICRDHGEFQQIPFSHIKGFVGCPGCKWGDVPTFIRKAKEVWEDRWEYSKAEYRGSQVDVTIICKEHGEFLQMPTNHLQGKVGCSGCLGYTTSTEDFIRKAKEVWGDRWDYSKVEYVGGREMVRISCLEHGEFDQSPNSHLAGNIGCRDCQFSGTSVGEQDLLKFILSLRVEAQHRVRGLIPGSRTEVDIYIPSSRLAIEYNGLYYHSSKFREKNYHHNKYKHLTSQGIQLIQVWEDDWVFRRDRVEEHLKQVLEVSTLPKVPARKTQVVALTHIEAEEFLQQYHIQEHVTASYYYGLRFNEEVVAVASFKKRGNGDLELLRYATSANVQGGHSKLVAHVERNHSYRNLVTFADLTFGDGGLYRKTGWIEDGRLSPDYSYLVGNERKHKFGYRLKKFREDPNLKYEEGLTEKQLADLNGLLRVYDAGKIRFIRPHPADTTM